MDDLTLEEEEYTEDNDDYTSILRPAFAVDGEPDFDSGEPEDGFEYLRRVRYVCLSVPIFLCICIVGMYAQVVSAFL